MQPRFLCNREPQEEEAEVSVSGLWPSGGMCGGGRGEGECHTGITETVCINISINTLLLVVSSLLLTPHIIKTLKTSAILFLCSERTAALQQRCTSPVYYGLCKDKVNTVFYHPCLPA